MNEDTENTVDDIFCLFESILHRVNDERKHLGTGKVEVTDHELRKAVRDYVDTYPKDKIQWG